MENQIEEEKQRTMKTRTKMTRENKNKHDDKEEKKKKNNRRHAQQNTQTHMQ